MEHNDPLKMVAQLRAWVDECFRSLNATLSDEDKKNDARERYREITKLINLHEKLEYPIPERIKSEKMALEEYFNAPGEEESELTFLASELSVLAKNINHQLRQRRGSRLTKGKRAPGKRLQVTFPDGRVIREHAAVDTFVKAIQHIGLKRVLELPIRLNGRPLVSTQNSSSELGVREVDGYFVATHSNTEQKARCIRQIAATFRIEILVEVMETV